MVADEKQIVEQLRVSGTRVTGRPFSKNHALELAYLNGLIPLSSGKSAIADRLRSEIGPTAKRGRTGTSLNELYQG